MLMPTGGRVIRAGSEEQGHKRNVMRHIDADWEQGHKSRAIRAGSEEQGHKRRVIKGRAIRHAGAKRRQGHKS